jgi:signal transduction histidine kinase
MQTLAPIRTAGEITGYIVVTEPFHEFLALTDKAFAALLARGLLAMLLGAGVMLAFAAVLGWRLRRIHQTLQTESLLKGQIDPLPISPLGDEIDELATRFNQQLGELSDYQRYLTSLNQTLAHELRTPVAIIASSLDNLREVAATGGQGDELLERARVGVERLQAVFSALQEARRIEQALDGYEQEKTDLVALLTQLCTAYQQTLPTHAFSLASDAEVASAIIAPDAVVQAIDKLVDNAVSFSPADTGVVLRLEARGLWWRIGVENTGPSLPNPDDQSLFEPLVSRRSEKDDHQHMGLGLHIVRLVARQHGGEPFAQNLPDGSGVRVGFTVRQ